MNKILHIKHWATLVLASLFVAVAYEMKINSSYFLDIPSYIVALFGFLFGATLSRYVVDFLLGKKCIRKIVIGESWIEGYWVIKTDKLENDENPIEKVGILYLEYKINKGELKGVATRLNEGGDEFVLNSEMAFIREEGANFKYFNYFKLAYPGPGFRYGMAFAELSKNSHVPTGPNTYEGNITIEGDGVIRRQSARKIPDTNVKELVDKYGENWIKVVLLANGIFEESILSNDKNEDIKPANDNANLLSKNA